MSVKDLLHHIRKEASYDDDDDGEPGRTAGQQLHKDEVHVLRVQERPEGRRVETGRWLFSAWKPQASLSKSNSNI